MDPGADNRYGLPADPSQEEARQLVRNERFIELAFEMQRFWDLKRWKAGDWLDGAMMHGMQITKKGDEFSYQRIETRHRYFKDNQYYFPIPPDERSEEHTSELQSLMRISYAVFCLKRQTIHKHYLNCSLPNFSHFVLHNTGSEHTHQQLITPK